MLGCEIKLADKTWVRFAKDGMSVAWNDLTCLKLVGDVRFDIVTGPVFAVLLFKLEQEVQAFLVGQAVQRSRETVHASGERQIRVR